MNLEEISQWLNPVIDEVASIQTASQYKKKLDITTKASIYDFVTDIDKHSEELLVQAITKKFPDHGILAEEGTDLSGNQSYRWIIDPLDGTANYINGLPFYSISVCLEYEGRGIFSIVKAPSMNLHFEAREGEGSYLNGNRVYASEKSELNQCLIGTGFPTGVSLSQRGGYILNKVMRKTMGIRRMGSAALDLAFVACGWFDGFWHFNLNTWDLAGGSFLVKEAGGRLSVLDTEEGSLLIAGNNVIHNKLINIYNSGSL